MLAGPEVSGQPDTFLKTVDYRTAIMGDLRSSAANLLALSPLGWLMARAYQMPEGSGWWATLLFAMPLYVTSVMYHQIAEMREMFTQTIGVRPWRSAAIR